MLYQFFICFVAGIGAGLGTGFAGMSAAAVISPMLITFLDVPAYSAVGIALASDVLASAVSAYTYGRNQNLDVKNGVIMMATVLCFTLVGSWISSLVPGTAMGGFSVFMTLLLGIKFIVRPVMTTREKMGTVSGGKRAVQSILCGMLVGFICGFVGAGGGMMMLLILTSVLGYELKTAVGTSVFIMTFTALTGAVSHFAIGGAAVLRALHPALGADRRQICQPGGPRCAQPGHRRGADRVGRFYPGGQLFVRVEGFRGRPGTFLPLLRIKRAVAFSAAFLCRTGKAARSPSYT